MPQYHREFNSILKVWGQVKGNVTSKRRSSKVEDVQKLTLVFAILTAQNWQNYINYPIKNWRNSIRTGQPA